MAPRSLPRSQATYAEIAKFFKRPDGSYDLQKFKQLRGPEQLAVLEKCWDGVHDYFKTGRLTESSYRDLNFMTDAMDAMGFDVGPLQQFLNSIYGYSGSTKLLQKLDEFKQKVSDPDLLASITEWEDAVRKDPLFYVSDGTHHGRSLEEYQKKGIDIDSVDPKQYDALGTRIDSTPKDAPVNSETPAEPNTGVLTDKPLNDASLAETPSGALTRPPAKLPEAGNQSYTGNEPPIADYNTPIMSPGVHVGFDEKPTNITPEGITVSKPNSASPSPEAIGEAMRDAIKDRVGDTQLNKEDTPAFLTKEGKVKAAEDTTKAETITGEAEKTSSETAKKEGTLTDKEEKPAEPSEGMFKKIGSWMRNHPKISWGVGSTTALGLLGGIGISQADKIAEMLKAGKITSRNANEESVPSDNINYRVWENYTPDYLNEEYIPGKIPSHIPQDNLDEVKESTVAKKSKSQPQVVNTPAPVNNATADYVRAAYNSYIPSDAGRAYQKAIYGDPLELERNRQQQKWRDFVMRSGQSPAELVQRGLMPYDALQYV